MYSITRYVKNSEPILLSTPFADCTLDKMVIFLTLFPCYFSKLFVRSSFGLNIRIVYLRSKLIFDIFLQPFSQKIKRYENTLYLKSLLLLD